MKNDPPAIKVSIVEDDVHVRANLTRLIGSAGGLCCVSQHPTAENALKELPISEPDVVLMDINLPRMSGVECVRRLKELLPKIQVVMLTVYEDTNIIYNALASGASGYLLKKSTPDEIIKAIADVHAGGSPMTGHIARKVVTSFQNVVKPSHDYEKLSPREQQVISWLAQGYTYQEIADTLKISQWTVQTHIRHIYEKLHVQSRTQAVTIHLEQIRLQKK